MAFLDDILGGGRWLDQLLGTQYTYPNLTADETQRGSPSITPELLRGLDEKYFSKGGPAYNEPTPPPGPFSSQQPQATPQSIAEWLRANGLLGAGPQGTSPGLLRPNTNPNLQTDEAQRGVLGGPLAAPAPQAGVPLPTPDPRGSIPFDAFPPPPGPGVDLSAASKKGPLPPQPLVGDAPQPPAEPDPGIFGRLQAGATNFTSGGNPIAGLLNAVQGLATGTRTDKTGIALAQQAQSAKLMYEHLVNVEKMEPSKAAAFAKIMALNPKVQEEFFKSPTTVEGAVARRLGIGSGSTDEALQYKQKAAAAEKAGGVQGEAQATAQQNLLPAVAQGQEQIRLVNELLAHPGRNQIGWHDLAGKAPLIPSTKGYGAQVLLDQIKGGAFLEGFKSLKGSGAITEIEGTKATTAINRMERATSRAEFEKAAKDYIGIVKLGIDRAMSTAGAKPPYGFKGNQGGPPPGFRVIE